MSDQVKSTVQANAIVSKLGQGDRGTAALLTFEDWLKEDLTTRQQINAVRLLSGAPQFKVGNPINAPTQFDTQASTILNKNRMEEDSTTAATVNQVSQSRPSLPTIVQGARPYAQSSVVDVGGQGKAILADIVSARKALIGKADISSLGIGRDIAQTDVRRRTNKATKVVGSLEQVYSRNPEKGNILIARINALGNGIAAVLNASQFSSAGPYYGPNVLAYLKNPNFTKDAATKSAAQSAVAKAYSTGLFVGGSNGMNRGINVWAYRTLRRVWKYIAKGDSSSAATRTYNTLNSYLGLDDNERRMWWKARKQNSMLKRAATSSNPGAVISEYLTGNNAKARYTNFINADKTIATPDQYLQKLLSARGVI